MANVSCGCRAVLDSLAAMPFVTTGELRIIPSVVIFTHFIVITGFDDTFKLLERLSLYVFDLPVDVAVNQFQQIEEAF